MTSDVNEYQKGTKISDSGELLAISSSSSPGLICVFKAELLKPGASSSSAGIYRKTLGVGGVNDLDFSPNSKKLAYINDTKLYIVNSLTGDENIVVDLPRKDCKFAKLRFIDDKVIIIAANINGRKGVVLYKFNPITGARLANKTLTSKIKAISSMDAGTKYIILGASDCSIAIVSTSNLGLLKKLEKVHEIAITSVSLNPSQGRIASTSVSGTVRVLELPLDGIFNGGIKSIIYAFWSVILIGTLAIVLQVLIKRQFFDDLIGFVGSDKFIKSVSVSESSESVSVSESSDISASDSISKTTDTDTDIEPLTTPTIVEVGSILLDNHVV